MRSWPANAATSISSVLFGRWKLVSSRSTTRNAKPGVMKRSVSPCAGASGAPAPLRKAVDSSARRLVVPTATIRPPRARARSIAATASAPTSKRSLCITCSPRFSLRTGWNVPAPTCSVTAVRSMPRSASAASSAASKCSAAVGAATAPGRSANTVW